MNAAIRQLRAQGMGDIWDNITGGLNVGNAGLAFYGQFQQLRALQNASGQQGKQLQQQFDAACLEVEALFHSIFLKSPGAVTQADYQAAAAGVAQLQSYVDQNPSLQNLWADPNYKSSFMGNLAKIQALAAQSSAGAQPGASPTTEQSLGGMNIPTWALVAVAALFFLRK